MSTPRREVSSRKPTKSKKQTGVVTENFVGQRLALDPEAENPEYDTDNVLNETMPTQDGLSAEGSDDDLRTKLRRHGSPSSKQTTRPPRSMGQDDLVTTYARSRTYEDLEKKPKTALKRAKGSSYTGGYTDLGEGRSRVIKRTKRKKM